MGWSRRLRRWAGILVWACGLTTDWWAPHKPILVYGVTAMLLAAIGTVLLFGPRERKNE